jgi:hypothetical protein
MLNKNKRLMARFLQFVALAFIGINAMQFISLGFFVDTYASLHYMNQTMGVAVDFTRITPELGYWTLLLGIWLAIVQSVVLWYLDDRLNDGLKRKWPDLKVGRTKKRGI